jgi:hypothetical protein
MGNQNLTEEEEKFQSIKSEYKFIKNITDDSLGTFQLLQHLDN